MGADPQLGTTFDRLVRFQTLLWNAVDAQLRATVSVPLGDVSGLHVVQSTPRCRVQDLVTTMHITVGGASKLADRLVAAGYVVRAPHPEDRRSSLLVPTEAGVTLLDRATPIIEGVLESRLRDPLTSSALSAFDTSLQTLSEYVAPVPISSAEGA